MSLYVTMGIVALVTFACGWLSAILFVVWAEKLP